MIAFDFDDTIANLSLMIENKLLSDYNMKLDIQNRKFYHCSYPGVSESEMDNIIRTLINKYTKDMEPEFSALPTLQKVYELTKKPIMIISNRGEKEAEKAREWLNFMTKAYTPFKFELYSARNKHKIEFIKQFNIKYYVEDKLEMAEELVENESCLKRVYLINKPWNKKSLSSDKIFRIYKLSDIYDKIIEWI